MSDTEKSTRMPDKVADTDSTEATPLELFFDLVFVFGFLQLSHHLSYELNWRGLAETLVLLVAVVAVWGHTSWIATVNRAKSRHLMWMVLGVMGLGLFLNAGISSAFGDTPWNFVVPLLAIHFGRTLWAIIDTDDPVHREHFQRVLIWYVVTAPLWTEGALLGPEARLPLWAFAALVDAIGSWVGHPIPGRSIPYQSMRIDASHMIERCALFLLVALGETVLATGLQLAEVEIDGTVVLVAISALGASTALWLIMFGAGRDLTLRKLDVSTDQTRLTHRGLNAVSVIVAGLVLTAVGNYETLAHPMESVVPEHALWIVSGPIVVMAGHGYHLRSIQKSAIWGHLVCAVVLLGIGIAGTLFAPAYVLAATAAVLFAFAFYERVRLQHNPGFDV